MTSSHSGPNGDHVGGPLNLFGVLPGEALRYEGKAMPHVIHFDVSFESSHDEIDRLILPPPLTADRSAPPIVTVSYFTNAECYGMDGRNTPYQAVMLTARTQWGDYRGVTGWEFVDGLFGDKTEMDVMGLWGLHFGMLKKFADIQVTHTGADEFTVQVVRRGKVLVRMGLRTGERFTDAELTEINGVSAGFFGVRAIPNVDYSGYVEHSVVWSDPVTDDRISRAWHAQDGWVEFGSGVLDPLADLPVKEVTSCVVYDSSSRKEHFGNRRVIGDLLRDDEHQGRDR